MRRLLIVLSLALPLSGATRVTLFHFSDYHSHALPFYTESGERGGIARAVGYLRAQKRGGALVFNGGDTINKGSPAWSDKFGCAEWSWLNGIVDAMAFGNHDADYGLQAFQRCAASIRYDLLSANTKGFRATAVLKAGGARIGVFAVAGSDFSELVKVPGLTFGDPVAAAREAVRTLREIENVDAVVLIGHQHAQSDYELARAVPGIDLIFGTHSHLRRELTLIPGTQTWFVSAGQYLELISRVVLTIDGGRVVGASGGLVPVDERLREDRRVEKRVRKMQRQLENDPHYRQLFLPIGRIEEPMRVADLAQRALEVMRRAGNADVALSTHSSFRHPLPAGPLTLEALRSAMPYDNEIVVCSLPGAELQRAVDDEMYVSGPIEPDRIYRVATTDYVAFSAYKDVFASCEKERTGKRVRAELRASLSP